MRTGKCSRTGRASMPDFGTSAVIVMVVTAMVFAAGLQYRYLLVAALLTMLNSCAAGVGVMNIDNGFGAACLAHRINLVGVKS